jgi:hypothetical protein
MAEPVLYTIRQGDCLEIALQLLDDDNNDAPIDLTAASVEAGLEWFGAAWSIATPAVSAGADGRILALVPASVTEGLPAGRETRVQVRVTFPGGCPQTVLAGAVRVHDAALES